MYLLTKSKNEDHVSCLTDLHLAKRGRAGNFSESKSIHGGGKLKIFSSPRLFI